MAQSGMPKASAWARRRELRTPCMATRSAASLIVVSRAATPTPRCWTTCKVHALSLPELQANRVFTLRGRRDALGANHNPAQHRVQPEELTHVDQVRKHGVPEERDGRDIAVDQPTQRVARSEEHTSELQSRQYLVCRLLLEKK